jgi:hypothetical protein
VLNEFSGAVPIKLAPSRKVTDPVAKFPADTVALNVTGWPNIEGFGEEVGVDIVGI